MKVRGEVMSVLSALFCFFFFKQKTAYEMRISDWSSDVCSSDLVNGRIAYKIDNPNMEFAIFGRNLANKKYLTRSFADLYRSLGIATEFSGESRTWGLSLTWRFGQD